MPREELSALVCHHKHLRGGGNADVAFVGWSAHIAKIPGLVSGGIEREGAFRSATVGAVHTERSLCRAALSELDGQFAAMGCDADRDVLELLNDPFAARKPVVAHRLTETEFTAAQAALYSPSNDAADLATQVARLAREPELRADLGRVGLERAQALTWSGSEEALLDAYGRLCCRRPRRCSRPAAGMP